MPKSWSKLVLFSLNVNLAIARTILFFNNSTSGTRSSYSHANLNTFVMPECHYHDSKLSECIQGAAEYAKAYLAHGIPAFGIQPLEPLEVPSVRLKQPNQVDKDFKFDAWLSDVTVNGLTDYSVNHLDINKENSKAAANITLPFLHMTGEFMIVGHFQMLPIELIGQIVVNFTLCTALIEAQGVKFHMKMIVRDTMVRLRCTEPVEADLNNANSPSDAMEKITDHIVSMHSNEVLKEIQPAVEKTLASLMEEVANKFLKQYSFKGVFP